MTVTDAATTLGYTPGYVRELCSRGVLPAIRRGHVWQIDAVALARWRPGRKRHRRFTAVEIAHMRRRFAQGIGVRQIARELGRASVTYRLNKSVRGRAA